MQTRWIYLLAAALVAQTALAQINVPAEVEQHKLVVASLAAPIPDGAYLADGGWEIVGSGSQVADTRPSGAEIVWTGPPGEYQVLYDGVLLQDVTFVDGAKNPVTIRSYVGRIKERATCTIKGGQPDPGPDPPVPPPGTRWALVVEESSTRTPAQANLWTALRKDLPLSRLLIVDKDSRADSLRPYLSSIPAGTPLPVLCVVHQATGEVVRVVPVPGTVEAFKQELSR
jgi:hypothetical protein